MTLEQLQQQYDNARALNADTYGIVMQMKQLNPTYDPAAHYMENPVVTPAQQDTSNSSSPTQQSNYTSIDINPLATALSAAQQTGEAPEIAAMRQRAGEVAQRAAEQRAEADTAEADWRRDEMVQAGRDINLAANSAAQLQRQELGGAAGRGAAAVAGSQAAAAAQAQETPAAVQRARNLKYQREGEMVSRRQTADRTRDAFGSLNQQMSSQQRAYEDWLRREREKRILQAQGARDAQNVQGTPGPTNPNTNADNSESEVKTTLQNPGGSTQQETGGSETVVENPVDERPTVTKSSATQSAVTASATPTSSPTIGQGPQAPIESVSGSLSNVAAQVNADIHKRTALNNFLSRNPAAKAAFDRERKLQYALYSALASYNIARNQGAGSKTMDSILQDAYNTYLQSVDRGGGHY